MATSAIRKAAHLYQVATSVLAPSEIATPTRQLETKQKNLSVMLADVTGIDLAEHTVEAIGPGIGSRRRHSQS
jgi:NADH:ubiquinone reductase (H+-translocating)